MRLKWITSLLPVLLAVWLWALLDLRLRLQGGVVVVVALVIFVAWDISVLAICSAKGHRLMFWIGMGFLLVPLLIVFPSIGTFRLARPDSRFAQKYYDANKLELAQARYRAKGKWSL